MRPINDSKPPVKRSRFHYGRATAAWRDIADYCWERAGRLRPHERDFVWNMAMRGREPTALQAIWLYDLYQKLGGRGNDPNLGTTNF
jgi:hypothetical protein